MKFLVKLKRLNWLVNRISFFCPIAILVAIIPTIIAGQKKPCADNPYPLYNRELTMKELARQLENSIPEYKKLISAGLGVTDNRPRGFFVYDLADPANNKINGWDCVNLIDRHVYHVAPYEAAFSFSHIVVLENGKMKIFKSINCRNRGDTLEDVIAYLNRFLEKDENKSAILERVKKYREFGKYFSIDDSTLRCDDVNNPH